MAAKISRQAAEAALAARKPEAFEIWEENLVAFRVFTALETQWRLAPAGLAGVVYIGLDYQALEHEMRVQRIHKRDRDQVRADVRAMERAARPILNGKDDDGDELDG